MFETNTTKSPNDELTRCRERAGWSIADKKRFGGINPVVAGEYSQYLGSVRIGQNVFATGDQRIGLTTKIFLSPGGQISHLAVRAARVIGKHKMVPFHLASDVTPYRILLSITLEQFQSLPDYRADSDIEEAVDRALWADLDLRGSDYPEIDAQVRDGVITLNGHVASSLNQRRAETAVKNIPGILGLRSELIPDDKLAVIVADAVAEMVEKTIPAQGGNISTRVENGRVTLEGDVSSVSVRDDAEGRVSEIPWVRGVVNELRVPGAGPSVADGRFLQPAIGKDLVLSDGAAVTARNVVINPRNRRVTGVLVAVQVAQPVGENQGEAATERLKVLAVGAILHLSRSGGSVGMTRDEIMQTEDYDPSRYITPDADWTPPYPYCTDEVLFLTRPETQTRID